MILFRLMELRPLCAADFHAVLAPGVELAARRRIGGAWDIALQGNALVLPLGIRNRNRGEQRLGTSGIMEFLNACL